MNGFNDNGVPIRTILISIWQDSFEDSVLVDNSQNLSSNGTPDGPYQWVGADTTSGDRGTVFTLDDLIARRARFAFNFFRLGIEESTDIPDTSIQRRVVIVNGSNRELLVNFTPEGTSDVVRPQVTAMRQTMIDAINSVTLAPAGVTYDEWVSGFTFSNDVDDFTEDADNDGSSNGLEFSAGTDPVDSSSVPLLEFEREETSYSYSYQMATDRIGVSHGLEAGPLDNLEPFSPEEEGLTREPMGEGLERVTVTLPLDFGPFIRQSVIQEPS